MRHRPSVCAIPLLVTALLLSMVGALAAARPSAASGHPGTRAGPTARFPAPQAAGESSHPAVFVADGNGNAILEYAKDAKGQAVPVTEIRGPDTGLDLPWGIALDRKGDLLVVNNGNSSITEYAKGASGNATPIARVQGAKTTLDGPVAVALDNQGNRFVTSGVRPSARVTVYAPGATGDTSPIATISLSASGVVLPWGVAVDAQGHVFVADEFSSKVVEFAKDATGDATPIDTLSGQSSHLNRPLSIAVNAQGDLLIGNSDGTVVHWDPPSIITTTVGPIPVPTALWGTALDASGDLFVTTFNSEQGGSVYKFARRGQFYSNFPIAKIELGFAIPRGIAVEGNT